MDPGRLKSLPLFEGVSEEELSHISPFVDETSVAEGTHLVDEGDYSYQFMAIEEGSAEVVRGCKANESEREIPLQTGSGGIGRPPGAQHAARS